MAELSLLGIAGIVLIVAAVAVVLYGLLKRRRSPQYQFDRFVRALGGDAIVNHFIPDGAGGEIHIDRLVMTPFGLVLVDTKDMHGAVFAGDRMNEWTVTFEGRRLVFENPIPQLQERAAALALLARNVPIEARVLFTDGATFPKGHPEQVATVTEFLASYQQATQHMGATDYAQQWQQVKGMASPA